MRDIQRNVGGGGKGGPKGLKKNEGLVVGTVGILLSNSGAKSDTFLAQLHSKLLY